MSVPLRNALAGVAAVIVITIAGMAIARVSRGDPDIATYEVGRGRFLHQVDAEGVLVAEQATVLSTPRGNGEAMKIAWLARNGSFVEADQVVIRFDPTDMENERFAGESDRAKAVQQVTQHEIEQATTLGNLDRDAGLADLQLQHAQEFRTTDEEIFSRNEIIESQIDQGLATKRRSHAEEIRSIRDDLGEVELQLIELEKEKAQLAIDKATAGLRELEVRAPHEGIFVLRRDWGEEPTVGQMAWPGMPLAEIPRLEAMKAQVFVLEADAGGVEPEGRARVVLEAHPGQPIEATVRRVAAVAKRRTRYSPVQYFEVELELAFTDPEKMKPGQRVRATLLLQDLENVIAVPREAIFQDGDGNPIVYRRAGSRFEQVLVELGPTALGRAVISAGLEAGDVIALADPLRDGRGEQEQEAAAAPGIQQGTGMP